jgi:glycosyltransferase involved in cell wall biosynthesis
MTDAVAKLSIVTPSFNSMQRLPALIASLRNQSDKEFEWVVADGGSNDGTTELLGAVSDLNLRFSSQPDFGIYDALNRALRSCSGDYYIVAGTDDEFAPDAVARFREAIRQHGTDLIVARARRGARVIEIKKGPPWLVAEKAFIANHSLSTAFRVDLHRRFGWYSRRFPIAADSLFVLQSCQGGASRTAVDFIAGTIGNGVSVLDWAGAATELFRVQLSLGRALTPQVLLLLLRLAKGASLGPKPLRDATSR